MLGFDLSLVWKGWSRPIALPLRLSVLLLTKILVDLFFLQFGILTLVTPDSQSGSPVHNCFPVSFTPNSPRILCNCTQVAEIHHAVIRGRFITPRVQLVSLKPHLYLICTSSCRDMQQLNVRDVMHVWIGRNIIHLVLYHFNLRLWDSTQDCTYFMWQSYHRKEGRTYRLYC